MKLTAMEFVTLDGVYHGPGSDAAGRAGLMDPEMVRRPIRRG